MAPRRDDLERQINLTFAFLSAESFDRKYLTQAWIRSSLDGYRDMSMDSFRKALQRDLVALRKAGVPIESQILPSGPHEGKQAYRLDSEGYELKDIEFTPEEAAVLGLAGELGQDLELGAFARSGWTKIAASGANRDLGTAGAAVSNAGDLRVLSARDLDAIMRARHKSLRIQFTYTRSRTESPGSRSMDVWGLVPERDRIYLVGHDIDRDEVRCFRITRISGVRVLEDPVEHPAPPGTDLQAVVRTHLRRDKELIDAHLTVREGRAVALTSEGTHLGDNRWVLKDVDRDWLIRNAAAHAPEAIVTAPRDVVDEVIALLSTAQERMAEEQCHVPPGK